jgi:hypothetical protein
VVDVKVPAAFENMWNSSFEKLTTSQKPLPRVWSLRSANGKNP